MNYQIKSIGFQPGQHALDAGCGIAVPAIYFATHAHVHVDAITISNAQYIVARQKVAAANLSESINVAHGDYHNLADHFKKEGYDVLYFLESFGHSRAKGRLVDLSPATARKIGITRRAGVARVSVSPIQVPLPDGSVKPGVAASDPEVAQLR